MIRDDKSHGRTDVDVEGQTYLDTIDIYIQMLFTTHKMSPNTIYDPGLDPRPIYLDCPLQRIRSKIHRCESSNLENNPRHACKK